MHGARTSCHNHWHFILYLTAAALDALIAPWDLTYSALPATSALCHASGTRRLLWRLTLGRLVSPDAVIKGCESKVEGLRARVPDFATEAQKLEVRAIADV